jgi:WD40 repeat protein
MVRVGTGNAIDEVTGQPRSILSMAFSHTGKCLALNSFGGQVFIWDLVRMNRTTVRFCDSNAEAIVAFPRRGLSLAFELLSDQGDGTVLHVRKLPDQRKELFKGHRPNSDSSIDAFSLSLDGMFIAYKYGCQTKVRVWDVYNSRKITRLSCNDQRVSTLIFSPDGQYLAGGGQDGSVWIWDINTGKTLHAIDAHVDSVSALAFSPDNKLLLSGGKDNNLWCWETLTGNPCWVSNQSSGISNLTFSKNGRFLITALCGQKNAVIISVGTSKAIKQVAGHKGPVTCVVVSPDGKLLATGSEDTTALVWRLDRLLPRERLAKSPLQKSSIEKLWSLLSSQRSSEAHVASWFLSDGNNEVISFLNARVHPAKPIQSALVTRLIRQLNSEKFTMRARAKQKLRALGELAEPELRQALNKPLSAEARHQVLRLLDELHTRIPSSILAQLRAVTVLERIGSDQAVVLLKKLVKGARRARLTKEAQLSLKRLQRK